MVSVKFPVFHPFQAETAAFTAIMIEPVRR
jgi:hypothetical protein